MVFRSFEATDIFSQVSGYQSLTQLADDYAKALAANPWLAIFPALLANVTPVFADGKFYIVDLQNKMLEITEDTEGSDDGIKVAASVRNWQVLAVGGGKPLTVFGEFDGQGFRPLSAFVGGRVVSF